ncbi:SymE family type I addiction module toxin [Persicitalea jodogahamensis]|uniref:Toxin SymE-like domain-containing protein n=1 Tax=Persicitalea jodogahamensis TaxID=402147 RepID=A0A8J3D5U0_9BACT|nr:SymE family type I addiction module toxin [Persicitalea jodogahamensis]GHB64139.1 hypothetical protein GCM10007390_17520 [Persicitalea jodogahamensis]
MANVQKVRTRTIGYQPRQNVWREVRLVPALQLAGVWMEDAGFAQGDQVEVVVMNGVISIRKI